MSETSCALAVSALLALVPMRAQALDLWERAADPSAANALAHVSAAEELLRDAARTRGSARWMGDPAPDLGGFLRAALEQYRRALEETPDDVPTLAAAASIAEQVGDHAGAEAMIENALALSPQGPETPGLLFDLALVHTRTERYIQARDDYLRELSFPLELTEHAVVLGNLADTYVSLVDLARAEDAYERCVTVAPGYSLGWLGLAVTYDRDGRREATVDAQRALHAAGGDLIGALDSPSVFFVPDYDREYYAGMAWEAVAEALDHSDFIGARRVALAQQNALAAWGMYVHAAPPTDPWLHRAQAHIAALQRLQSPERPAGTRSP